MYEESRYSKASIENESLRSEWTNAEATLPEPDSASSLFQIQNYHLHLKQKKEKQSDWENIPSSKMERLSYYRAYLSSPNRKQILVMQHAQFNVFLWYYLLDVFLKSLPQTYVHIFLASYSPEDHMFLPKMVPISNGCKCTFILVAFVELLTYVDTIIIMMNYALTSIVFKNPWNRCTVDSYVDQMNYTVNCYNVEEFIKKFQNDTPSFQFSAYISSYNETFQLTHIVYYRLYRRIFTRDVFYFVFIWVGVGLFHTTVMSKSYWKIMNKFQWIVNFMDLGCFVFLATDYLHGHVEGRKNVKVPVFPISEILWEADVDMLVASTTALPVIHILTARSTQRIQPSGDSSIIILSNALCCIFRGLLISQVKSYCEYLLNAPLFYMESNCYSWFFIYTIFFSTFYLGDLFAMGFYSMYLITELMVLNVTYQCLVETMIQEWKYLKRWLIVALFTVSGIITYCSCTYMTRYIVFIYGKAIAILCETIFLYILYPLERLVDDYMFHYGVRPTTLRIWSLRIVPVYYILKFYRLLSCLLNDMIMVVLPKLSNGLKWYWAVTVVPLLLGTIVVVYNYVVVQRQDWRFIFRPVPNWGPKEFQVRQMRKQFDSRNYIASQYPRPLSRYLIKKGEVETYELVLRYDNSRNTTVIETDYSSVDEKNKTY